MIKDVLVFLPKDFSTKESGFIKGFCKDFSTFRAYYILGYQACSSCPNYIGYVHDIDDMSKGVLEGENKPENTIYIKRGTQTITINDEDVNHPNITEVLYDLNALENNHDLNANESKEYGVAIQELIHTLAETEPQTDGCGLGIFFGTILYLCNLFIKVIFARLKSVVKSCAVLAHLESNIRSVLWFTNSLQKDRRLTTPLTYFCVTKGLDVILGIVIFYLGSKHKELIMAQFHYMTKDFITHLRELLIYLMGSPIGLKLNYAFNNSLGKFFFYHINLWQVFLQTMEPLLDAHFHIILLPALMGLSYQIAVLSDIISLSTFHVYCIYVYAARLFLMQVRSIVSLWRLFIGQKYNPLRVRVDSCEYSSNQLLIGTLGFTVLLFLLPTTAMYYMVFAAFRLLTLIVFILLNKLQNVAVASMPLCLAMSWILRSSGVPGNIQLELKEGIQERTRIEAKLVAMSIGQSMKKFSSTLTYNNPNLEVKVGSIIWRLCTGQLV